MLTAGFADSTEELDEIEGDEERLARSGVEEIHQSVHYALELLRRCLDLLLVSDPVVRIVVTPAARYSPARTARER